MWELSDRLTIQNTLYLRDVNKKIRAVIFDVDKGLNVRYFRHNSHNETALPVAVIKALADPLIKIRAAGPKVRSSQMAYALGRTDSLCRNQRDG